MSSDETEWTQPGYDPDVEWGEGAEAAYQEGLKQEQEARERVRESSRAFSPGSDQAILMGWVWELEGEIERLNVLLAGLPGMREEIDALRGHNTGFAGGTQGADEVPA